MSRSIYELRRDYERDRNDDSCVVIKNIRVDLRNIKRMDSSEYKIQDFDYYGAKAFQFEFALGLFYDDLIKRNIPFDKILITGEPGIAIKSRKHREILEDFIKKNYEKSNSLYSLVEWEVNDTISYINNLTIDDVTYNYVPLNFTFEPYLRICNQDENIIEECSSFNYLRLPHDNETKFSALVPFEEFVKLINDDGYHILFNNDEITTYEEYFEHMKNVDYSDRLTLNIDLERSNNIKR